MRRLPVSCLKSCLVLLCAALLVPAAASASDMPTVRLLEGGKGKKETLRLQVKEGTRGKLKMTMLMNMKMSVAGNALPSMPMPAITFEMDSVVTGVTKDGEFHLDMTMSEVGIEPGSDAPEQLKEALTSILGSMKGIKMSGISDSRGQMREPRVDIPSGTSPQVKQMLDSMRDSMKQMSTPLPKEPVGLGGKWEVVQKVTQNGMTLSQVAVMTLEKRKGSVITMTAEITQSAESQDVAMPGLPPGAKVALTSLKGSGKGTTVMDLKRATPTSSTVNAKSDVELEMDIPKAGGAQTMAIETTVKVTMEGKPVR
jgi:hypothetical protein